MNLNEFLKTLQEQGHLKIKVGPNSENEDTRELPLLVVDVHDEHGEVILDISAMTAERLAILVEEKISQPKTYLDGNLDASDYLVSIRDGEKSEEVFGILKIEEELLIVREQDESTICSPKVGVPELVFALLNRHPGLQDERILIRHGESEYTVSELEVNEDGRVILTSGGIVN
jgi:hypothetical protein